MAQATYTIEQWMIIHDDQTGDKLVIRPDRDALGLIEIVSYIGKESKEEARLTLKPQQAGLLANAIRSLAPSVEHPKEP